MANHHASPHEPADFCVNCEAHKLTEGARQWFAQVPLHPTEDDLSFGQEVGNLLRYARAVCYTLGYSTQNLDDTTAVDLAQCGVEVIEEAQRRLTLFCHAADLWQQRYDELKKAK